MMPGTINRKIQGTRAGDKPAPPADGSAPKDGTSTSQQSYDLMIDHFDALITLITSEPTYKPNEQDLTATALQDFLKNLQVANKAVKDAETNISTTKKRVSSTSLAKSSPTFVPSTAHLPRVQANQRSPVPQPQRRRQIIISPQTVFFRPQL